MEKQDRRIGTLVDGRYRIKQLIGSGASSEVYLAEDSMINRRVALKILSPDTGDLSLNSRAFLTEVHAVARLSHQNIVRVHDVSLGGADKYIVMEYVEGITLREYMNNHPVFSTEDLIN